MGNRIYSFDTFRTIAIIFVVTIHTNPFNGLGLTGNSINFVIDGTARFAVPLFFLISGYLFSMNLRKKTQEYANVYFKRIVAIYIFGIVVAYSVDILIKTGHLAIEGDKVVPQLTEFIIYLLNPAALLYYGPPVSGYLWFIPALGYSIFLIYFVQRKGWILYLLIAATALHCIGIAIETGFILPDSSINVRDTLFFGLFYTTIGYWVENSYSIQDVNSRAILSVVAGLGILHLLERYFLGYVLNLSSGPLSSTIYSPNYSILTPFFAIAVFLFVLSTQNLGEGTYLQKLGGITLGIYIIHLPILKIFIAVAKLVSKLTAFTLTEMVIWHILLTPTVYILSVASYITLGRLGIIDYFYSYRGF